jgi:hypothetical protein
MVRRRPARVLEAPEAGSWIALVDVSAGDADAALASAWEAYRPGAGRPPRSVTREADSDGWTDQRTYHYQTSPNERRSVQAGVKRHGDDWTVWIYDMLEATAQKRLGQVALILNRLLPAGYQRETFAGRRARPLDRARLAELIAFIERGRALLGVPGVALGLVQDGKVVFEGGSSNPSGWRPPPSTSSGRWRETTPPRTRSPSTAFRPPPSWRSTTPSFRSAPPAAPGAARATC